VILVDSSVWIDYFNGTKNWQTDRLDTLLDQEFILMGDLILAEVLQGFKTESMVQKAQALLSQLTFEPMMGKEIAIQAAKNYRLLRSSGITPRKTIDVWIATFCIQNKHTLLNRDRDFEPMRKILRLEVCLEH